MKSTAWNAIVLASLLVALAPARLPGADCPRGDLSGDCAVTLLDLRLLAEDWLQMAENCSDADQTVHWAFEEVGAEYALDAVGGLQGLLNDDAAIVAGPGRLGAALKLDGRNDFMQAPTDPALEFGSGDDFTITLWVNTGSENAARVCQKVEITETGASGYGIFLNTDTEGDLSFRTWSDGDVRHATTSEGGYNDGLWHHIAAVRRAGSELQLYVDGQLRRRQSVPGERGLRNQADLYIGCDFNRDYFLKGYVDDFRIYRRALSVHEISRLMSTGTTQVDCRDVSGDASIDTDDLAVVARDWQLEFGPVIISELMAVNRSEAPLGPGEILDGNGQDSDWIELHNPTTEDVILSEWHLTDDADDRRKWPLPTGLILPAGAHLVVFASGKEPQDYPGNYPYRDPAGYYHTNFKLTSDGEYLALVGPDGQTIHEYAAYENADGDMGFPKQSADASYGIHDGRETFFATPTPGGPNLYAYAGLIADTTFSHDRGFYDAPFHVTIDCDTRGADIHYTLNGSEPTLNSPVYTEPILIDRTTCLRAGAFKPGYKPSGVDTQTYFFLDDMLTRQVYEGTSQNRPGPEWPYAGSGGQWIDYGLDPAVLHHSEYKSEIRDAFLAIPSMSLVTDLPNLFSPSSGIYVNASQSGPAWERPASLELINPDGSEGFQVNCGIRIRGGFSVSGSNPKHAFRFFFRSEYGDAKLNYPLFGDEGVDEFDKVDLRTSQNYSWAFQNDSRNTFMREVFQRDTQRDMDQPYTRSRYYHLYINGQYWGLYMTQERAEANFSASYFGGSDDDYDTIKHENQRRFATDGNTNAYDALWNLAVNQRFDDDVTYYRALGCNPDGSPNPQYPKLVDIDNLIVYMLGIFYSGDRDAPISNFMGNTGLNNFYTTYNRVNPDGFKCFRHDGEHTLDTGMYDRTGPWRVLSMDRFNPQTLHEQLVLHPEYRMRLADLTYRHFFNDGALTPEKCRRRVLNRARQIESAIIAESARWGDAKGGFFTKQTWLWAVDTVLRFFDSRGDAVISQLRADGWYPYTNPPTFSRRGGYFSEPYPVNLNNPNGGGRIYYTLDGTDPRTSAESSTGNGQTTTFVLVQEKAPKRVWIPDHDIGTAWTGRPQDEPFDDSQWTHGHPANSAASGGVGYEKGSGYETWISYDVESRMRPGSTDVSQSAYVRIPFALDADDLETFNYMTLKLRVDDGAVIYLNGSEIWRENFTGSPRWNSSTGNGSEVTGFQTISVNDHVSQLRAGNNVLALHGINTTGSSDFLISAELVAGYTPHSNTRPGEISDTAIAYTGPFNVARSTHVKARVLRNEEWSPLNEAVFAVGDLDSALRITEIFYHPDGDPNTEFIELANTGDEPVNCRLVQLDGAVRFTFPSLVLQPGEHALVVRDREAFRARFGADIPIAGRFEGALDNTGETLHLRDPHGRIIQTIDFDDEWRDNTDGLGFSLTAIDAGATVVDFETAGLAAHWEMEQAVGGAVPDRQGSHPGEIAGDPQFGPGKVDAAIQLDGQGDFVRVDSAEELTFGPWDDFSVSCWIRTTQTNQSRILQQVGLRDGKYYGFALFMNANALQTGTVSFRTWSDDGVQYVATTDASWHDGDWHHITGVLRAGRDMRIFVDGELQGSRRVAPRTLVNDAPLYIGCSFAQDYNFAGQIDEVRIYRRALDDGDIRDLVHPWNAPSYWRSSSRKGGSPGQADPGLIPNPGDVVINEVMSHSHSTAPDWLELHNTTDGDIDIGGWFLSDQDNSEPNMMKYEIAPDTILPAHGYRIFREDLHFGQASSDPGRHIPFGLSEGGETVYLFSGADGELTGYADQEDFGAAETGVAFGRFQKTAGNWNFVAMSENTPGLSYEGAPNAYPKVGPIIITEIMYNPSADPADKDLEYVELMNISALPQRMQTLAGTEYAPGQFRQEWVPWRLTDGIEHTFPDGQGLTLQPGQRILLVKDIDAFEDHYTQVPQGTLVIEWDSGSLANEGEKLQLSMPGDREYGKDRYFIRVDRVNYEDRSPWPVAADGAGFSLTHIRPTQALANYGNDPAQWTAAEPTPGW